MQQSARIGTTQAVAYTGTAAASSAFSGQTYKVRLTANSACHYTFAAAPVATTDHPFLPANAVEYVTVTPGQKVSAVRAASDGLVIATSGTLLVTELS